MYRQLEARFALGGLLSEGDHIDFKRGVVQGDCNSMIILNATFAVCIEVINAEVAPRHPAVRIVPRTYADDIAIFAEAEDKALLQRAMEDVETTVRRFIDLMGGIIAEKKSFCCGDYCSPRLAHEESFKYV